MNMIRKHEGGIVHASRATRHSVSSRALAAVLVIEGGLVAWLTILLVVDLAVTPQRSIASSLALLVLAVLSLVWIAATVIGTLRGHAWSRASSVTIQLIVLAVSLGSFEGIVLQPIAGVPLLVLTLAGVALALFSVPPHSHSDE